MSATYHSHPTMRVSIRVAPDLSFAKMLSGANAFKISGIHRNVTMSHRVENRSMTRFVGAR
jgi:hypothetical protein